MRVNRHGVLKTEALLAMVLLVGAMSFASSIVYKVNRLWGDAREYQFAVNELSNQLQQLVLLSPEDARKTLGSIAPSDACKQTLKEPDLVGVLAEDKLGSRVTLQLTWKERRNTEPIMLSAWLKNHRSDGPNEEQSQ